MPHTAEQTQPEQPHVVDLPTEDEVDAGLQEYQHNMQAAGALTIAKGLEDLNDPLPATRPEHVLPENRIPIDVE